MQFVLSLRILAACALASCFATAVSGKELLLQGEHHPSGIQRIKQKVDISGELHLDPHGKGVTKVPLTISAHIDFHQRCLPGGEPLRVRYYHQAEAEIRFGEGDQATARASTLKDVRRTLCLTRKEAHAVYYAPNGSLTREERELVDTPLCRTDLIHLLPNRKVAVNETWSHQPAILASLLNLDTVGATDCTSRLASLENGKATMLLEGTVNGAVDGVATEIDLKAKYLFDSNSRRVISLSLAMREKREVAPANPGFDVVTKIAMAEAALPESAELTDAKLAALDVNTSARPDHLQFESPHGGYRLLHDARWRILLDDPQITIFRFVDNGELVAQANLSRMLTNEAEAAITLEAFSEQVGKALAENSVQLLESKQYGAATGNRVLRVEAAGTIAEVPMRWIYFHVSAENGLRAAGIITVEERLLDRLAGADADLINALELVPLPEPEAAE